MTASMLILTLCVYVIHRICKFEKGSESFYSISKIIIKTIITIITTILLGFVKDLYYTPKVS